MNTHTPRDPRGRFESFSALLDRASRRGHAEGIRQAQAARSTRPGQAPSTVGWVALGAVVIGAIVCGLWTRR